MQDNERESSLTTEIKDLLKKTPGGLSVTDIARALNKNKNTIGRYMDILLVSGQVNVRSFGMAKVFTYSPRVPFSSLLSYGNDLIMVLDRESRIIEVNNNFLQILRLSRNETIGQNISFFNPPEVDLHELVEAIGEPGREKGRIITFRDKQGDERIFNPKILSIVLEDGNSGTTIILEDITEKVQSERKIRESEERFRMMADNIQDGLLIMEDNEVVYSNKRITEITGYSMEEIRKMDPFSVITPSDRKILSKKKKELQKHTSQVVEIPIWIVRKDGMQRFILARVTALPRPDKFYHFTILTDFTDQAEKDSALRESEQRFRMMAENIQDGLIIIESGKVVFINHRVSEIFGYSKDELIAMNLPEIVSSEFLPGDDKSLITPNAEVQRIEDIIRRVRPGEQVPGEFQVWIQGKDLVKRHIHGRVTAVENEGIISSYITITDITHSSEKEQALRERIESLQDLLH